MSDELDRGVILPEGNATQITPAIEGLDNKRTSDVVTSNNDSHNKTDDSDMLSRGGIIAEENSTQIAHGTAADKNPNEVVIPGGVTSKIKQPVDGEDRDLCELNSSVDKNCDTSSRSLVKHSGDDSHRKSILVSLSHILSAVREVKPSVSFVERQKYEALHKAFSKSDKVKLVVPAPGKRATLA